MIFISLLFPWHMATVGHIIYNLQTIHDLLGVNTLVVWQHGDAKVRWYHYFESETKCCGMVGCLVSMVAFRITSNCLCVLWKACAVWWIWCAVSPIHAIVVFSPFSSFSTLPAYTVAVLYTCAHIGCLHIYLVVFSIQKPDLVLICATALPSWVIPSRRSLQSRWIIWWPPWRWRLSTQD